MNLMSQGSFFTINPVLVIVTKQIDIAMRMVIFAPQTACMILLQCNTATNTSHFVRLYIFWPKVVSEAISEHVFFQGRHAHRFPKWCMPTRGQTPG